jgi:hypothetical protein
MGDDRGVVEKGVSRIISGVVPPVVDSIDVNGLIEDVDLNGLLDRIDIDALLTRIDINQLVSRVDVNGLIADLDVNALLDDVDLDSLMEKIDLDKLLEGVDLEALMRRANIGDIVAESTGQVAGSALDLGRRQVVGIDVMIMRFINRILSRDPEDLPVGPALLNPGTPTTDDWVEVTADAAAGGDAQ